MPEHKGLMKEKGTPESLLFVISRSLVRTFIITMGVSMLLWFLYAVYYTLETVKKDSLSIQGVIHTALTDALWEMDNERLTEQAEALFHNWNLSFLKLENEEGHPLFEKQRNGASSVSPKQITVVPLSRQGYPLGTVSYGFDYSLVCISVFKGIVFFGLGGVLVLLITLYTLRKRLFLELQKPLDELKALIATYAHLLSEDRASPQERDKHIILYNQVPAPLYKEFKELYELLANLKNTILTQLRQLEEAHRERELLLREVNHRVFNNLQLLGAILNQQAEVHRVRCSEEYRVFDKVIQRIEVLAEAYNQLWESNHVNGVEMAQYLRRIVGFVQQEEISPKIQIHTALSAMVFPLDVALACGLICYELLTNALFHAYEQKMGAVWLSLKMEGPLISFSVRDEGKGCPYPFDRPPDGTVGFRFVRVLADQIRATLVQRKDTVGCHVELTFPRDVVENSFKEPLYSI